MAGGRFFFKLMSVVGEARALTPIANTEVTSRTLIDFRSEVSSTREGNLPMGFQADILGGSRQHVM